MAIKATPLVSAACLAAALLTGCTSNPQTRAVATSHQTSKASPSVTPTTSTPKTTPDVTLAYFRPGLGVVGMSPECCGYEGERRSQLWLTTDMRHWHNVTPPGSGRGYFRADRPSFEDASFINDRTGWVTTWDGGDIDVQIFRTTNAGKTWSSVSGGEHGAHAGAALRVQPITATVAYKEQLEPTAPAVDLSVSHDDGRHWAQVYDGPPMQTHRGPLAAPFVMPMVFASELTGFAADGIRDDDPIDPEAGYLFMTQDGGRSWTRESPPRPSAGGRCPKDASYEGTVACLDGLPTFSTPSDGALAVVLRDATHAVLGFDVTSDGGTRWSLASVLKVRMPTLHRRYAAYDFATPEVSVASPNNWWVVESHGGRAVSWHTTDAGRHWHRTVASLAGTPAQLSATGGPTAWMTIDVPIHRDGEQTTTLMRTTDGGRTWHQVVPRAAA